VAGICEFDNAPNRLFCGTGWGKAGIHKPLRFGREDVDSAPALPPEVWLSGGVGSVAWVPA